jgi:hypothetical protein
MFWLVADLHPSVIGSHYRHQQLRHALCRILKLSPNSESTIFSFASWVIYVPIGCRHPFSQSWHPSLAIAMAKCILPHPENERQQNINILSWCIIGNQSIAWILAFITELLTSLIGKYTVYSRKNTNSKLINIGSCKTCKNVLLVVENTILLRYY